MGASQSVPLTDKCVTADLAEIAADKTVLPITDGTSVVGVHDPTGVASDNNFVSPFILVGKALGI